MIEDHLAEIQLHLAGLATERESNQALKLLSLTPEAQVWPFRQILADLQEAPPPVIDTRLLMAVALANEPNSADAAFAIARDHAQATAPALWTWFSDVRRKSGGWDRRRQDALGPFSSSVLVCAGSDHRDALAVDAVQTLREMSGAAETPATEPQWRRLQQGAFLHADVPPFPAIRLGVAAALRDAGVLPARQEIRTISSVPTRASCVPIRIPGESVLVVHDSGHPSALQYIHHELAHAAEHGCRMPDLSVAQRWSFDPALSEGWALLLESLVQDNEWLALLGISEGSARRLAAFFQAEDVLTRGLIHARAQLDRRADTAKSLDDLYNAALDVSSGLGIACDPWILVNGLPNAIQWHAYETGYCWRDAVIEALRQRCGGEPWWNSEESWQSLRAILQKPTRIDDALRLLTT